MLRVWPVLLLAVIGVLLAAACAAQADQMTVFVCHEPSGVATPFNELSISHLTGGGDVLRNACPEPGGLLLMEVPASEEWEPRSMAEWNFLAPKWAAGISAYEVGVTESYTQPLGMAYVTLNSESKSEYGYLNDGDGSYGMRTIESSSPVDLRSMDLVAACISVCPDSAETVARLAISSMAITLGDPTTPEVTQLTGSLISGEVLHGTAIASVTASDAGPGIYGAELLVDGAPRASVNESATKPECTDLGQTRDSTRSFARSKPCPESATQTLALNTATLTNGQHSVEVRVEDASGNSTVAYKGTITVGNAPEVLAAPVVSGAAQVGSTLTATAARFQAPEGTGELSTGQRQWLGCIDASATHCTAIVGATGAAYSPTNSDVGRYLIYQETSSDSYGTSTSDSKPTAAVSEPANEVASFSGQSNPPSLQTETPASNGDQSDGAGGSPLAVLPIITPGPSGSASPWQLTLRAHRSHVRRGVTLALFGMVTTRPLPAKGKLIDIRDRTVLLTRERGRRLKRIYGPWHTFAVTHTRKNGCFVIKQAIFELAGPRHYEFDAIAPVQAGYQNSAGTSRRVSVQETAATARKHRKVKQGAAHHG